MPLGRGDCQSIRAAFEDSRLRQGLRYREVARWLQRAGFVLASTSGSHRAWKHPSGRLVLLVERGHGDLKAYQVKTAVQTIIEVGECDEWP